MFLFHMPLYSSCPANLGHTQHKANRKDTNIYVNSPVTITYIVKFLIKQSQNEQEYVNIHILNPFQIEKPKLFVKNVIQYFILSNFNILLKNIWNIYVIS